MRWGQYERIDADLAARVLTLRLDRFERAPAWFIAFASVGPTGAIAGGTDDRDIGPCVNRTRAAIQAAARQVSAQKAIHRCLKSMTMSRVA
jgi:hypothetical protein